MQVEVIIAFIIGIIAGGLILVIANRYYPIFHKKFLSNENIRYIKGFNYILSNDHDSAIEELTKIAKMDTDIVDTYFALGALFRAKGDLEKAIKIHQDIIIREDLNKKIKLQARYELAVDYKKAGMINRAITIFEEIIKQSSTHLDSYIQLSELYEKINEWEKALIMHEKIIKIKNIKNNNILAHIYTEIGKNHLQNNELTPAKKRFNKALALDPKCIHALFHLGHLYFKEEKFDQAAQIWEKILDINPAFALFVYPQLELVYEKTGAVKKLDEFYLLGPQDDKSSIFTTLILARQLKKSHSNEKAIKLLSEAINRFPYYLPLKKELGEMILEEYDGKGAKDSQLQTLVEKFQSIVHFLPDSTPEFQCSNCGYASTEIHWKCPQCLKWDKMNVYLPESKPTPRTA